MNAMPSPENTASAVGLADHFKVAMSLLAGGVTVVTAGKGDNRRGLTATAVCSLSMSPPSLLVCVNSSGEAHTAIVKEQSFCVNILAADDQVISDRFAGRQLERGAEKFRDGEWGELVTGAPALNSALVAVDCEVYSTLRIETHTIFLGHVKAVQVGDKRLPLLHFDRKYCSIV